MINVITKKNVSRAFLARILESELFWDDYPFVAQDI